MSAAAIASLVLGIMSLLCLGPLAGIPAIICGSIALSSISSSEGRLTGGRMAIVGQTLGGISFVMILLVMALPGVVMPTPDSGFLARFKPKRRAIPTSSNCCSA